ncbi:MAG: MFS transporter [Defluviitaleaceae bacterium]|nr:MFS transporter [Defluviitaleaceae bacterium]
MLELFKGNKMFRRFLVYGVLSALGGGIFQIFMLLSIHLLYENPIYTGIAGALIALPHIFAFAVGPVVDRRNKVSIMRITIVLEFIPLALLAFTPLLENIGIMFMFAVIITYSVARLFEGSASGALLPQLVKSDELMKANSFANLIAMSGGLLVAVALFFVLGDVTDFSLVYGASAGLLVIAFLFSLLLKDPAEKGDGKLKEKIDYIKDLKIGGKFVVGNALLFFLVATVALSFVGEVAYVNRPEFFEYHVGSQGYIVFTTLVLVGGIVASALTGAMGQKIKIGPMIFIVLLIVGFMRIAITLILPYNFGVALTFQILAAAFGTVFGLVINSYMQKITPKDMMGRVGSIFTTPAAMITVLGALVGGFVGSMIYAVDYIFIFQGVSYIALGIFLVLIPKIRKLPKINDIESPDNPETE